MTDTVSPCLEGPRKSVWFCFQEVGGRLFTERSKQWKTFNHLPEEMPTS